MKAVPLGELVADKVVGLDPSKAPSEEFELWSIPSFDVGEPDIVIGADIGSAKKCVEPGDVLLSRIVPHIRRSWVVTPSRGRRQIASGEWIVFRNRRFVPEYLRHFLISDLFHSQFMLTVAGVGGSLLRARPDGVAKIEIPLPPLDEQRRIAAILDQTDALRRKRREVNKQTERLAQAALFSMLGDPETNPFNFPVKTLGELILDGPTNGLYKSASEYGQGAPILRINNFYDGKVVDIENLRRLNVSSEEISRYALKKRDIIINRVNSKEYVGKSAIVPDLAEETVFESNMMRFSVNESVVLPEFCIQFLQTSFIRRQIETGMKDAVNQSSINQKDVKSFKIVVPPLSEQNNYTIFVGNARSVGKRAYEHATRLDGLFASLQQRAFRGEL